MKKVFALLSAILIVLTITSCAGGGYDEGYQEGYSDGHADAMTDRDAFLEDEFLEWYDSGYDEGRADALGDIEDLISEAESNAYYYAFHETPWSPEEALGIIHAYQNQEPLYDGQVPSSKDYADAVESLCKFYEYFYCGMYRDDF